MRCLFTEDPEVESPYRSGTALEFYQQMLGLGPSGDHKAEEFAFYLSTSLFFILFLVWQGLLSLITSEHPKSKTFIQMI